MLMKPFRPPLLVKSTDKQVQAGQDGPPAKKRRISPEPHREDEESVVPRNVASRWPAATDESTIQRLGSSNVYYNVLWYEVASRLSIPLGDLFETDSASRRNFNLKKHKTWDGDGILMVGDGYATLMDSNGKRMGRTVCRIPLLPEAVLAMGTKEVQIESVIPSSECASLSSLQDDSAKPKQQPMKQLDAGLRTHVKFNPPQNNHLKDARKPQAPLKMVVPPIQAPRPLFKVPLKETTVMPKSNGETPVPRHDPDTPGALVMKRPAAVPSGKQVVDVVVDPMLTKHLREHQRTGVQFLYECVMGMRPFCGDGAILADEMGLGKTLQVITLLWTLMKQSPIHGDRPVIRKALIVCPVTLIKNWKKEFRKWLGLERLGVFVLEDKSTRLTDFTRGKSYNVMIIGYEKLRTVLADLQKGDCIDIVVADEGHRLKTAQNKSAQAIKSLSTSRKVILSGTPLQNDLSEFYFMVDFVNPGLLGKVNAFKREFETPILQSRQPGASAKAMEKGEERASELANLTSLFILRRTADILAEYLPQKTEYVLFCRPTAAQASVYRNLLSSSIFSAALNTPEASLQLIDILKKLCNSPSLLRPKTQSTDSDPTALGPSLLSSIPPALVNSPGASGKLQVFDSLLHHIHRTTDEKVVIVSHYTSTLDVLEKLLVSLDYSFLRLDGSTTQSKRQGLVDRFNSTDARTCFAFLLSAKSGGMGLNLTGASRCLLFDCSWNPSTDLQAMARIHRDGQRRPCMIYRLLTQGAIDEKMYQRQLTKLSLADSVVDNKVSASSFTREELRDLFRLDEREECQTHELLGCECGGNGMVHESAGILISPAESEETKSQSDTDDDELPDLASIIKASQLDVNANDPLAEDESATAKKRSKANMQMALMRYRHFSTAKLVDILQSSRRSRASDAVEDSAGDDSELDSGDAHVILQDKPLMEMLKDADNRVSFVFAKSSSS